MRELQIFVTGTQFEQVVSELGLFFGVEEFLKNKGKSDPLEFYMNDIAVGIQQYHPYDDDRDLDFSNYEIFISLRALNYRSKINSYHDMFEAVGRYLTEKISSTLTCKTMLVQDIQIKLATWETGKVTFTHESKR